MNHRSWTLRHADIGAVRWLIENASFARSRAVIELALEICDRRFQNCPEHIKAAITLAEFCDRNHDRKAARRATFRAEKLVNSAAAKKSVPPKDLAKFKSSVAWRLRNVGLYQRARKLQEEALEEMEESGYISQVADCLLDLGRTLVKQGLYERAKPVLERSLTISTKIGENEYWLSFPRWELANCLSELENFPESEALFKKAADGLGHFAHGPDFEIYAQCMYDYAKMLAKNNRPKEAAQAKAEADSCHARRNDYFLWIR